MASKAELRHIVWRLYGIRARHDATAQHLRDLIFLKIRQTPANPVNQYREELMRYVSENKQQLSLFCDGNCHGHTDATVLYCYTQLEEAKRGKSKG
jgi:hypothetical protein